jgi:hypothetical protein
MHLHSYQLYLYIICLLQNISTGTFFIFAAEPQWGVFLLFWLMPSGTFLYHTGMRKSPDAFLFIIVLCCSCCWLLMMVLLHQEHVEPLPALHEIEHHVMLTSNKHHAELHAASCTALGTSLDKKRCGLLSRTLHCISTIITIPTWSALIQIF